MVLIALGIPTAAPGPQDRGRLRPLITGPAQATACRPNSATATHSHPPLPEARLGTRRTHPPRTDGHGQSRKAHPRADAPQGGACQHRTTHARGSSPPPPPPGTGTEAISFSSSGQVRQPGHRRQGRWPSATKPTTHASAAAPGRAPGAAHSDYREQHPLDRPLRALQPAVRQAGSAGGSTGRPRGAKRRQPQQPPQRHPRTAVHRVAEVLPAPARTNADACCPAQPTAGIRAARGDAGTGRAVPRVHRDARPPGRRGEGRARKPGHIPRAPASRYMRAAVSWAPYARAAHDTAGRVTRRLRPPRSAWRPCGVPQARPGGRRPWCRSGARRRRRCG